MKKSLSLFMAGCMILLMFVVPGSPVKAEEPEDCPCHDVIPITGAEKNKIISDIISKDEFKQVKLEAIHSGYSYRGVSKIEVFWNYYYKMTIVGVPFINNEGFPEMFVFFNGKFQGSSPM